MHSHDSKKQEKVTRGPTDNKAKPSGSSQVVPVPVSLSNSLTKKLEFLRQSLDLNNAERQQKEKQERLSIISELSRGFNDQKVTNDILVHNFEAIFHALASNLFRPLPPEDSSAPVEDSADKPLDQPEPVWWPHMQPVYELIMQIVMHDTIEMKILKVVITQKFLGEFLQLFESWYAPEREYLKNILHRLYAKLVPRRKLIRKMVTDTFHSLIHEKVKFHGCAELLDINAAVISGFAVPLREEHVHFFNSVIVALHKVQSAGEYHNELLRCSMLFISKDPSLAVELVKGLLRFWPFANYQKETKFLQELYEVLDVLDASRVQELLPSLFKQIAKCISSPHLQVADQALTFFENDYFLSLIRKYKQIALPILAPVISQLADTHWHKLLQDSMIAVRQILKDIDTPVFESSLKNLQSPGYLILDCETLRKIRNAKETQWSDLTRKAQQRTPGVQLPTPPYNPAVLASDFNGLNNRDIILVD